MDLLSFQGVVDNIVADIVVWLLGVAGAYMLTRWLKRYYSIFSPPVFVIAGVGIYALLIFTWNQTMAFRHERGQSATSEYVPATPCQLRISESEREKIRSFLQDHNSQRLTVKKIEIVVQTGKKSDCLYAEDLQRVFKEISWVPPEIVEEIPVVKEVRGKAVWFENFKGDEFAGIFWTQILCFLGQDFYHENQEDTSLKDKWMFYIRDSEGGFDPYSPEVICLNRSPSREILPRNP